MITYVRERLWDAVILDEAHKIKNRDTDIAGKCKTLYRHRAWALTGTPLENQEDDLASVCEFVTSLKEGEKNRKVLSGKQTAGKAPGDPAETQEKDVLTQLPPKITEEVLLTMAGPQRACYDMAEKEGIVRLKESGPLIRVENILELILKLKRMCHFDPVTGRSVKMDDMKDRLSTLTAEGYRAIIFSQYTDRSMACARSRTGFRILTR